MQHRELKHRSGTVAQPQLTFDAVPAAVGVLPDIEGQRRRGEQAFAAVRTRHRVDQIDLAGIELRLRVAQREQPPPPGDMRQNRDQLGLPQRGIVHPDRAGGHPVIAPRQGQHAAAGSKRKAVVFILRADQRGDHSAIVVERLLHRGLAARIANKAQPQRGFGKRGQRREIARRRVGCEIGHDLTAGPAYVDDLRRADRNVGAGLERQRKRDLGVRARRQAGNRPSVRTPLCPRVAHHKGLAPDLARAAQEALPAIEPADCFELGALRGLIDLADILADPGPGAREQLGIGQVARCLAQHLIERFGEDPAAVVEVFLGGLVAVAGGEQHVARLGDNQIVCLEHRGILAFEIGFERAREVAIGGAAHPGPACAVDIAGAAARMAAIEHPGDVRLVLRQFRQQQRQLLVGEVEIVAQPAVMANQPLIALVEIVLGKFRRGSRPRAVAAVVEIGDIVLACLPQMLSHLRNDIGVSRIAIGQLDDRGIGKMGGQVIFDVGGVRDAALKRVRAFRIAVYPDQQRIDFAHSFRLPQLICLRPRARLLSRFRGQVKGYQKTREPLGTAKSGANRITAPLSSAKPNVSTSDMNLPIWRGGKLTTAATCRPGSSSRV